MPSLLNIRCVSMAASNSLPGVSWRLDYPDLSSGDPNKGRSANMEDHRGFRCGVVEHGRKVKSYPVVHGAENKTDVWFAAANQDASYSYSDEGSSFKGLAPASPREQRTCFVIKLYKAQPLRICCCGHFAARSKGARPQGGMLSLPQYS